MSRNWAVIGGGVDDVNKEQVTKWTITRDTEGGKLRRLCHWVRIIIAPGAALSETYDVMKPGHATPRVRLKTNNCWNDNVQRHNSVLVSEKIEGTCTKPSCGEEIGRASCRERVCQYV